MPINLKSPETFTTAGPLAGRDPLIVRGALAMLDFTDAFCNPHADGAIPANSAFANLVDGAPGAELGVTAFANAPGKKGLVLPLNTGTDYPLQFPAGAFNFKRTGTDDAFVFILWRHVASAGFITTNYSLIASLQAGTPNFNTAVFTLDSGLGGTFVRAQVGTGTGVQNSQYAAVFDAVEQIGVYFYPATGQWGSIHNGVATVSIAGPMELQDAATYRLKLHSKYKQTTFALYLENLTASQSDILDMVAYDYAFRLPLITARLAA